MRERPDSLRWLAWTMALICAGLPLQVAVEYGYGPTEWMEVATSLAPLNWVLMAVSLSGAVLALRGSPWLMLFAPAFVSILIWNNWVIAATGINASPLVALGATAAGISPLFLLLTTRVRKVLMHPEQRWWLTPARRRARVEVAVRPVLADEWSIVRGATFDVSEGGAYIAPADEPAFVDKGVPRLIALPAGARCTVRIALNQFHVIQCGAQVVRRCEEGRGDYPPGFAVKFVGLDAWQREMLALYVKRALPDLAA